MKKINFKDEKVVHKIGEKLAENLLLGKPINKVIGISNDTLNYLYEVARFHYSNGDYPKAVNVFTFLLTMDYKNPDYRFGIGCCWQAQGKYPEAIEAFSDAGSMDTKNPNIDFAIAQCFFKLNDKKMALLALNHAEKLTKKSSDKELMQKIETLKSIIS